MKKIVDSWIEANSFFESKNDLQNVRNKFIEILLLRRKLGMREDDDISNKIKQIDNLLPPRKVNKISNGLTVKKALNRSNENLSGKTFDIIISNDSPNQFLLCEFNIQWEYYHGILTSIGRGEVLRPIADYIIELPTNTDNSSENKKAQLLDPLIVIPPSNKNGPSPIFIGKVVALFGWR